MGRIRARRDEGKGEGEGGGWRRGEKRARETVKE